MLIYIPAFVWLGIQQPSADTFFFVIIPLHLLGMLQNLIALILLIRDLFLRSFPKENDKLLWGPILLLTPPIGVSAYYFMHARKPRNSQHVSSLPGVQQQSDRTVYSSRRQRIA